MVSAVLRAALLGGLWSLTMLAPFAVRAADEFKITSPAFDAGGEIPVQYTCEGDNLPPPLNWSQLPAGTQSLLLIVDDPDAPDPAAPRMTWVHWLLYDLPVSAPGLAGGSAPLPTGTREGRNDFKRGTWGGPCPPVGRHRYFFKLYALDTVLGDLNSPDKAALLGASLDHMLGEATLIGTYQKRR